MTLRMNAWSKGLKKAGLDYRLVIQTRHTFATMMVSAGENLGWVQKMMGHKRPRIYSLSAFNLQDRNKWGKIYLALGFGTDFDLK